MEVAVVRSPNERHSRPDSEDVPLERKTCVRQGTRSTPADEGRERGISHGQEPRPVLKRLDRPPLAPARSRPGLLSGRT